MSELPPQVAHWLYNVIQPQYTNKRITYTHVYQFLQTHLNKNFKFKIRTSIYTSGSTGHSDLLINLYGSIKVNQQISVPVTIWIPLNYPYQDSDQSRYDIGVPMVYITPDNSKNWFLKPGNHVDTQGMFYHPFLSNWFHDYKNNPTNYNLIELVNVLYSSFIKDVPIFYMAKESEIPSQFKEYEPTNIPPKPDKIPINESKLESSQLNNSTQRNIPIEPNIPLKYQSPLPLPTQMNIESSQAFHNVEDRTNMILPDSKRFSQIESTANHPTRYNQTEQSNNREGNQTENFDLIDNDSKIINKSVMNPKYEEVLRLLSVKINEQLQVTTEGSVNKSLPSINMNTEKINVLYRQLSHHNQQATANSKNLEGHIVYLTNQLSQLTSLNNKLTQLESLNAAQDKTISVNQQNDFELDDLIIPDLALVNQLYDIVSEIKATKDAISLIGGSFHSESEIVDDSRMDACVKVVRGLGRELFWLEVMKREIAATTMGLAT